MAKNGATSPLQRLRELHAAFREAHRSGTRALKSGDYKAFGDAVTAERNLIQEQRDTLQEEITSQRLSRETRSASRVTSKPKPRGSARRRG